MIKNNITKSSLSKVNVSILEYLINSFIYENLLNVLYPFIPLINTN
jgi:Na+-translocating ferredoxin:NAD+ oxidoreductase RnfE subunit